MKAQVGDDLLDPPLQGVAAHALVFVLGRAKCLQGVLVLGRALERRKGLQARGPGLQDVGKGGQQGVPQALVGRSFAGLAEVTHLTVPGPGHAALVRLLLDDDDAQQLPGAVNSKGLKSGYNPYNSGALGKQKWKKKKNLRELSKWIELRKKVEQKKQDEDE